MCDEQERERERVCAEGLRSWGGRRETERDGSACGCNQISTALVFLEYTA